MISLVSRTQNAGAAQELKTAKNATRFKLLTTGHLSKMARLESTLKSLVVSFFFELFGLFCQSVYVLVILSERKISFIRVRFVLENL